MISAVSINQSRVDYCGELVVEPITTMRLCPSIRAASTTAARAEQQDVQPLLCVHQSEPRRLLRRAHQRIRCATQTVSINQSRVDYCGKRCAQASVTPVQRVHQSEPRRLLRQLIPRRMRQESSVSINQSRVDYCGLPLTEPTRSSLKRVHQSEPRRLLRRHLETLSNRSSRGVHQSEPRRLLRRDSYDFDAVIWQCPSIRAASTTAASWRVRTWCTSSPCPSIRAASTTAAPSEPAPAPRSNVSINQSRVDYCGFGLPGPPKQTESCPSIRAASTTAAISLETTGRWCRKCPSIRAASTTAASASSATPSRASSVHQSEPRRLLRPH